MFVPPVPKSRSQPPARQAGCFAAQLTRGAQAPLNAREGARDVLCDSRKVGVVASGRLERQLLQRKIAIGHVDDPLEHEADRAAEQVMRMPDPALELTSAPTQLNRKCSECEEADELRRKAVGPARPAGSAPPVVHDVLRGSGRPLDSGTRAFFEPRFGQDFSHVRVHTDDQAQRSAQAVNAMAYTVGPDIVFGAGRFSESTENGRRLMAHELAHVVQQGGTLHRLMRAPLLTSTMKICKRVLKGEHSFHVSKGGVVVVANATWEPSEAWEGSDRPQCGNSEYHISLSDEGVLYDSEYGTCSFAMGGPMSRQWTNLPEGDYHLVISTNNTNPNCCLEGEVEVAEHANLTGDSCTRPPPGPLEILHLALNIAGLIPALGAVPDAINTGIYLIEGDWTNAGISAIAIIPVFGDAASVVNIGRKTVVRVGGEAVEKIGKEEIAIGLKEARAAQASKAAKEAHAAREAIAGADEIKLTQAEYEAALKMVFPSQFVDPVAKLVDGIGQAAAARAMKNPRFVQALESGNMTLAGTFFHTAAKEEARLVPASSLPAGWALEAERTIKSGRGGSRADILLNGPGAAFVEFDWKTSGKSALSSGSRKEMTRHAGQITVNLNGTLTTQESRSWMDYVRPLL